MEPDIVSRLSLKVFSTSMSHSQRHEIVMSRSHSIGEAI
ncbi:hypothetical protein CORC01_05151 [Colletotrichum orchidophilum]|uniref:Uncharacterized protein n=1 Tax=Colletotrichum orchidophilum TaxID=1209926 RepID=A0A1G4BDW5_9PEZI|nr:uncharacterized protein CORC01_05151 [Colletotrichum orchidophilum]OHE99573.1 hypothetical protein CORC01_05151 [Colletotrichum orchidophilum]